MRTPYAGVHRTRRPGRAWRGLLPYGITAATGAALLLVAMLFLVSVGPLVLGWRTAVVESDSMAPAMRTGDVVITAARGSRAPAVGDIVRFTDPAHHGRSVLHRVVGIAADGRLTTAGDANPGPDSTLLRAAQVSGVARLHVPGVGLPVVYARRYPPAAIGFALLLCAATGSLLRRRRRHAARPISLSVRRRAVAAGVGGLVLTMTMGWQAAYAQFTARTSSPLNTFATGTIRISDDDGGSTPTTGTPLFNVIGLTTATPPASRCITVIYAGDLPAPVRLYARSPGGSGLGDYLEVTVKVGTGGSFADCTGFTPDTSLFTGTLAQYTAAHTSYADGLASSWTPSSSGDLRTFQITYRLLSTPPANVLTADVDLVWEARG